MSRLSGKPLVDFLCGLTDEAADIGLLLQRAQELIGPVARMSGLGSFSGELHARLRKDEQFHVPNSLSIYADPEGSTGDVHEIRKDLKDRGYTLFRAAPRTGLVWDCDMEEDFQLISSILFTLLGRARIIGILERMLYVDDLTGIGNTSSFFRFVEQQASNGKLDQCCINFLNIKNMRLHNSNFGEAAGNRLFAAFGRKLCALAGSQGLAVRIGSDNFVVILPAADEKAFLAEAQSIPVEFEALNGTVQAVPVQSHLGYYFIRSSDEKDELLNNASLAMMGAKAGNLGVPMEYSDELKAEILQEKTLVESAPAALLNSEFTVYYQPKVELNSRTLVGAEALVRWERNGELLPPSRFIPALEKAGIITRVDFFVFEEVCRMIKKWEADGLQPVRISSNFSRLHLFTPDFADRIINTVHKYRVDPSLVEVEITESYAVGNIELLRQFQARMHEVGIRVSIDDFGSGFSSLHMLKKVPVDLVKIDKTIIDGINLDYSDDEIIAGKVIQMIRELNKEMVAEGVETEEQIVFLRLSGCHIVQGFYFDRPLTGEDFTKRLANKHYN